MHTMAEWKQVLNNFISVIVSIKHKNYKIWCATQDGMKELIMCQETGFHDNHQNSSCYSEANHVTFSPCINGQIRVIGTVFTKTINDDGTRTLIPTRIKNNCQRIYQWNHLLQILTLGM